MNMLEPMAVDVTVLWAIAAFICVVRPKSYFSRVAFDFY